MRNLIRCAVLSLLAVVLLAGSGLAAEYDGYIIRLKPQVELLSEGQELPEGVEEVYAPMNLYTTHDETLIQELEDAGLLEYAEPNYRLELYDAPNDPLYLEGDQWNLDMLDMDYAWARNITGAARSEEGTPVRVGIVDTGLYAAHEDLQGVTILEGVNTCVSESSELRRDTTDEIGHGTFVSGIVAAAANNGIGMAGMAAEVELVPLKCYNRSGGHTSTIVAAILKGIELECQVLNMSLGVNGNSEPLLDAVAAAEKAGVILVAAAGNAVGGSTGDDPFKYPAGYDTVISVGAVDRNKAIASFSFQNASLDVAAPGKDLCSLGYKEEELYRTDSGTSFAAPAVTAAAALALSVDPELTPEGFRKLIEKTSEDLGAPGKDTVYGHGLLNVANLLRTYQSGSCTLLEDGEHVLLEGKGLAPGDSVWAVQAGYDVNGAQRFYGINKLTVEDDGTFSGEVELLAAEENGQARLMLLDSEWRPLMARWEKPVEEAGGVPDGDPPEESGDGSEGGELPPEGTEPEGDHSSEGGAEAGTEIPAVPSE